MKISCLPVSIFGELSNGKKSIPEWAGIARKIGYDGIDISIMFIKNRTPVYLNQLAADLEEIGLPIIMMTTYPDFSNPDPVQRKREFDYLVHDVALSSQLNIPYLRIIAGQAHPEMPIDKGIDHVVSNFKEIAKIADEYNVMLLYENHAKPGAWDLVDFSYPPSIFLKIVEGVWDTSIRINFDTGNFVAYGANPLDMLDKIYEKIETIHISDMRNYGAFQPAPIGEGVVPNKEILSYIKKRGFDGWLCIEEASGNGISGITSAYAYVKKLWEEI